jgi:predicted RNA-binding Zn ribbon-like protein
VLEPPASAVLVEAFANTVDLDLGTDELAGPERLSAWLAGQGLLGPGVRLTGEVHAMCLRLRAGIREQLGAHIGDEPSPDTVAAANAVLDALPVFIGMGGDRPALSPAPGLPPGERALAALAIAWSELRTTGDAARLKRCAEHTCGWVFWDVSKNRSRRWCSMRVCGNRAKARRHAVRHTPA